MQSLGSLKSMPSVSARRPYFIDQQPEQLETALGQMGREWDAYEGDRALTPVIMRGRYLFLAEPWLGPKRVKPLYINLAVRGLDDATVRSFEDLALGRFPQGIVLHTPGGDSVRIIGFFMG